MRLPAAMLGLLIAIDAAAGSDELLCPLFRDHAVLQRDRPIRIWGNAAPGADIQDRVMLDASEVRDSAFVRYGWADSPACNLYNEDGLPAVSFEMPVH